MMLLKRMCKIQIKKAQIKKILDADSKIPDISKLVTNSALNTKIGEAENQIPDVSKLIINSALKTKIVEIKNKFPNRKFCCKIKASKFSNQK